MDPTPSHPPSAAAPRSGWWSRNWKWFVPTGCLTVFLLFVAFIALIVLVVFGALKSTDVYKTALARAQADPAVIKALGTPIDDGLFLSGSTKVEGGSGTADLAIPISGPKGKGKIFVVATKSAGRWTYKTLAVEIAQTGQRIDLNNDAADPAEAVEE